MPDKKEEKVLDEIEKWQASRFKTGIASGIVNAAFYPVDRFVDFALSDKIVEKTVKPMREILENLQNSSRRFVNIEGIIEKARNASLPVEDLEDFRDIPIAYLDILAKSLFEKNALYTALQGAGMGTGGYTLVFVDLPMLFMINLKMIFQMGAYYGYNPDSIREKEFALRIFYIVSSAGSEQRREIQKMDELITGFIKGVFPSELSILATEEGITGFINRLLRWFIKKKATRGFPLVGIALGSGFNYLYTKEVAIYTYMFYRKRFLKEALLKEEAAISKATGQRMRKK